MTILQIKSSIRGENAHSNRLADQVAARLQQQQPDKRLVVRDLAKMPHPMLDEAALQAILMPAEQRTPAQARRVALDDELIAEVQHAEHLVIAAPMYNFGIPAQLKAWIDAIAKAGVTFRYTEQGPEGLLTGKTVYVIQTAGGLHRGSNRDSQTAYLQTVLGFLGFTDVHFIDAEGLAMGAEFEQRALQQAGRQIAALSV